MWTTVTNDTKQITDYQFRRVTIDLGRGDMHQDTIPCQDMEDFLGGIGRSFKLLGDYAVTGVPNISVIDSDSFWIDGYFEETKMGRVCVGDRAEAQLMGYTQPILGHVKTVTRGVSVSNAAAGTQGLPNVDPIYTWVRLAQRGPVRLAIDTVPAGVPLVSGMTATVTIRQPATSDRGTWSDRIRAGVVDPISELFGGGSPPRPNCLQDVSRDRSEAERIPYSREPAAPPPAEIEPGLTPGINTSPRNR